jgi:hypothetical protein
MMKKMKRKEKGNCSFNIFTTSIINLTFSKIRARKNIISVLPKTSKCCRRERERERDEKRKTF